MNINNPYYSLVTNYGLIKNAQSALGENLDLKYLVVGDGEGNPSAADTALSGPLDYEFDLTYVGIDEDNENQLIIEGIIPEEVGPFYVREVGILDAQRNLFAIGKFPETFKPNLPSGVGKRLYIRMILAFANEPNVNLITGDINHDPNFSTHVNDEFSRVDGELDNRLKISEDLSDLSNAKIARNNLGLKSGAISDLTASIISFPMAIPPEGWLECDGASLSRETYADLFARIGVIYGSDDADNFNIPDLRGEFVRGWDHGRGIDAGRIFGDSQNYAIENIIGSLGKSRLYGNASGALNSFVTSGTPTGSGSSSSTVIGMNFDASRVVNTANETRPCNIALMYCIKY
jgi:phage-related tail fiber protein